MRGMGWKPRALGATLALLVQALFLAMVLLSPSHPTRRLTSLVHETILLLPPLQRTAPAIIDARRPSFSKPQKAAPTIVPFQPPVARQSLAPPSGLAGFGQALFDCAPERYAFLTPDDRARCPKPGEGITRNDDKDLGAEPRSHAKYEARWKEQWAEDHWVPAPCLPTGEKTVKCLMDQAIAENRRARAAGSEIEQNEAEARKPVKPVPPISSPIDRH